ARELASEHLAALHDLSDTRDEVVAELELDIGRKDLPKVLGALFIERCAQLGSKLRDLLNVGQSADIVRAGGFVGLGHPASPLLRSDGHVGHPAIDEEVRRGDPPSLVGGQIERAKSYVGRLADASEWNGARQ